MSKISINGMVVNKEDSLYIQHYNGGIAFGYIRDIDREAIMKGRRQLQTFFLKDMTRIKELRDTLSKFIEVEDGRKED